MLNKFISLLKNDKTKWEQYQDAFAEKQVSARTILLNEGEISKSIYFIKKGCLRECFNKEGKDITFQFFIEGQPVASIDSFMSQKPSLFSIESIEPSTIVAIDKKTFTDCLYSYPELKEEFEHFIFQRFRNYSQLFLSRIKDSPQERYADLIKNNPSIIQRIPQHYIASYLGITPISLSRIRNRK